MYRRTTYKGLFLAALVLAAAFHPSISPAKEIILTPDTVDISNRTLKQIFDDIYYNKKDFISLDSFSENNVDLNQYDILLMQYTYTDPYIKDDVYSFGLTIVPMSAPNPFYGYPGIFEYGFPLLEIKFSGYQEKGLKRQQFDINESIRKFGQQLWLEQQQYLPLKLSIQPLKKFYKKGEPISFRVILKNESGKSIVVKDLNNETLFFVYNNSVWGAAESSPQTDKVKNVVLKPGESISKEFAGNSFFKPQEFEIFCKYNLTYDGVNPAANLKVKVIE